MEESRTLELQVGNSWQQGSGMGLGDLEALNPQVDFLDN